MPKTPPVVGGDAAVDGVPKAPPVEVVLEVPKIPPVVATVAGLLTAAVPKTPAEVVGVPNTLPEADAAVVGVPKTPPAEVVTAVVEVAGVPKALPVEVDGVPRTPPEDVAGVVATVEGIPKALPVDVVAVVEDPKTLPLVEGGVVDGEDVGAFKALPKGDPEVDVVVDVPKAGAAVEDVPKAPVVDVVTGLAPKTLEVDVVVVRVATVVVVAFEALAVKFNAPKAVTEDVVSDPKAEDDDKEGAFVVVVIRVAVVVLVVDVAGVAPNPGRLEVKDVIPPIPNPAAAVALVIVNVGCDAIPDVAFASALDV